MTRHDLTVDVSVDDCEAPSGLRPWLRDSSAYAKPSDRLKPRLRLLHDIMMFEVVGKFTKQSIGDILAKDWVVKRCADIAWTPTRAGLNQMKRKMAMLFSAQIDDEEGGATERHAESWEVALQSDMLRECALDARKGQDVEFTAADKGAKPVRAKITAVHSPSRGTDDEHFNLALPDGSEIRYLGSACSQLSSDTDDEQSEDTGSDAGMSVTSCSDRSGRPAPARSRSSSSVLSSVDEHRSDRKARLQELQELRASGLITEEMMKEKQRQILNGL